MHCDRSPTTRHSIGDGESGFSRPIHTASFMRRNEGKAVSAAMGWSRLLILILATNLATKSHTEAPQAIEVVDLLADGGLTLSNYSDSPTSFKVRTYVHLIFWLYDSVGIFIGLSTEIVSCSWDLMETDAAGMEGINS
jgi:hypothetical protein